MLNLQPLVNRFVEDVLRAVRGASLDELREAPGPGYARAGAASPGGCPARRAGPSPGAPPAPRARGGNVCPLGRQRPRRSRRSWPCPTRPRSQEITDPERLLAATVAPRGAAAPLEAPPADLEGAPPPSAERPTGGATARLRAGESLARATGAGVVIRRAKRA